MERHEDYCAGHLIEAGIAYANATGKKTLLDVGIRFADHIDTYFRENNRNWVSGHQEIELALMRLYHYTNNRKYLQLADWFLEQRGRGYGKGKIWDEWKDPAYAQDAVPVKQQTEITGHAVRAMYLYTGAADVAAVTNDTGYMHAMQRVWEDVVYRNLYITGGIGAQARNEGFGKDYDLPNEDAYAETCASVGMVFWNQRMNMLTGNTQYIDVLERSLYNAANDGLSLTGDRFFYGNPLASSGQHARREWFGTACCPSNIARLVASLGNYIYGTDTSSLYINLFIGSEAKLNINGSQIKLLMQTGYPWNGKSTIIVSPQKASSFNVKIRMPGWLHEPVPGELYHYVNAKTLEPTVILNGKKINTVNENGYMLINRKWKKGDKIEVDFPMEVREVQSREEVEYNKDRIALQRGPLVYCVEGKDNGGKAWNIIVPPGTPYRVSDRSDLLGGINTISFTANQVNVSADNLEIKTDKKELVAIPYYSWNNRGANEMQVWLPQKINDVKVNYLK